MAPTKQLTPVVGVPYGVFLFSTLVLAGFCLAFITDVYMAGLIVTIIVSLGLSAVSMQVIARTIEGRYMWPPREMYYGFMYGDLFALPTIAAMLCLMHEHPTGLTVMNHWWWKPSVAVGAVALALWFRTSDKTSYSDRQFQSPTKLWHDLFVIPVFLFFLASQAPLIYSSHWGIMGIMEGNYQAYLTTGACFGAFFTWLFLAGYWDGTHPKPNAHINYPWRF